MYLFIFKFHNAAMMVRFDHLRFASSFLRRRRNLPSVYAGDAKLAPEEWTMVTKKMEGPVTEPQKASTYSLSSPFGNASSKG